MKNFPNDVDAIFYRKNEKYPNIFSQSEKNIFGILTGLSASDGAVVLTRKKSAIFVDSRYTLAAKQCVDTDKFEILNLENGTIIEWIKKNFPPKSRIAFDPQYCTHSEANYLTAYLKEYQLTQINLKDKAEILFEKIDLNIYCINNESNKISHISETIRKNNLDAYLLCDPCSIAWLLNIRDLNQKYTPVVLGYLLITNTDEKKMYLDDQYGSLHNFKTEKNLQKDLTNFSKIGIDKSQTPFHLQHPNFIDIKNPCVFPKCIKSKTEINDIKSAAQKDSLAIIDFLHWFHNKGTEKITESEVVQKLLYFRKQQSGFVGESFKTIAAADKNAAIIHYSPSPQTDKYIENILLIDSGGQYKH
jgi:Xaa-Pro aminopeptidase